MVFKVINVENSNNIQVLFEIHLQRITKVKDSLHATASICAREYRGHQNERRHVQV